jgi:hypothetical protein
VLNGGLDEELGWRNKKSLTFTLRRVLESGYMKEGKKKKNKTRRRRRREEEEEEKKKKKIGRSHIEVFLRGCELE